MCVDMGVRVGTGSCACMHAFTWGSVRMSTRDMMYTYTNMALDARLRQRRNAHTHHNCPTAPATPIHPPTRAALTLTHTHTLSLSLTATPYPNDRCDGAEALAPSLCHVRLLVRVPVEHDVHGPLPGVHNGHHGRLALLPVHMVSEARDPLCSCAGVRGSEMCFVRILPGLYIPSAQSTCARVAACDSVEV